MATRLLTSLLLSGHGFFRAEAVGRLFIENITVKRELKIHTHLDLWNLAGSQTRDDQALNELEDWYPFICQNTLFRRAS
ncbi:hypothetical protein AMJ80_11380, partial [bacterium SM23_31]